MINRLSYLGPLATYGGIRGGRPADDFDNRRWVVSCNFATKALSPSTQPLNTDWVNAVCWCTEIPIRTNSRYADSLANGVLPRAQIIECVEIDLSVRKPA